MAKFIAQIIITGAQVVGRAFAKAIKEEIAASQEAARRLGNARSKTESAGNVRVGLSLEEAKQILNVSQMNKDDIQKRFDHLFKVNDKEHGGSFYIQSKIVRAKERLDYELEQNQPKQKGNTT